MRGFLMFIVGVIIMILLMAIFEQLHFSNLPEEQRVELHKAKLAETQTEKLANIANEISRNRIAETGFFELRSNKDRVVWFEENILGWIFYLAVLLSIPLAYRRYQQWAG